MPTKNLDIVEIGSDRADIVTVCLGCQANILENAFKNIKVAFIEVSHRDAGGIISPVENSVMRSEINR